MASHAPSRLPLGIPRCGAGRLSRRYAPGKSCRRIAKGRRAMATYRLSRKQKLYMKRLQSQIKAYRHNRSGSGKQRRRKQHASDPCENTVMAPHIQISRRLGKHYVKPRALYISCLYRISHLDNSLAKSYFLYSEEPKRWIHENALGRIIWKQGDRINCR